MSGSYRYEICDVFTDTPLAGNPLAVFVDARAIPEARLRPLAREINYSETVFAYPPVAGGHVRIRIFTPARELPFAGHPVLGSACVLAAHLGAAALDGDTIRLETGRGIVPVRLRRDGDQFTFGWMSQPLPTVAPFADPASLLAAVGVRRSALPVEAYDNGIKHLYVALDSEDAVARVAPDLSALARLVPDHGVSCFAGAGRRWKTRMFAPGHGVTEDPATGSAAGPLAVHLCRHGRVAFGEEIEIAQGVEIERPSRLHARVAGNAAALTSVEVGGAAVIVGSGEFRL
ncbi:MAG TPA: PhzF family phenazine biosynthesis protein [bacterium]|nr:PhzF family phenazine biosynthesis protein [bacterium]